MESAFAQRCRSCLRPATGTACFVAASVLFAAGGSVGAGLASVTIALGCWLLARWAESADRRTHATVTLGLWLVVLGGSLTIGLGRGGSVELPAGSGLAHVVVGIAIAGAVTTVYLAFREYGSPGSIQSTDDILETDPEY